jgi:LysM repeat protein
MSSIARKFGVTVAQLKAANPKIKNLDRIKIGDKINIPVPVPNAGAVTAAPSP